MKIYVPHYTLKAINSHLANSCILVIHISQFLSLILPRDHGKQFLYSRYIHTLPDLSRSCKKPKWYWEFVVLRRYLTAPFMGDNVSLADTLPVSIQESRYLILTFLTKNFTKHTLYIAHTSKLRGFIAIILASVQRIHLSDGFMPEKT